VDKVVRVEALQVHSDRSRPGTCTVQAILVDHREYLKDIVQMLKDLVNAFGGDSNPADRAAIYPLVRAPEGSALNIYQTQLSTRSPPPVGSISDRNSQMVFIAHALVWRGGCCVYGGFVRDLVVRGEKANDIDVGYSVSKTSRENVLVIVREAAREINLSVVEENPTKGMAYAIKLCRGGEEPFDVDLVNVEEVERNSPSPGVDCDVGNIAIMISGKNSFGMRLKITERSGLLSLAESQQHCAEKCFVFYYSMDEKTAQKRLKKYFSRGWVCLSQLSGTLLTWANTEGYSALLRPVEKYSIPFSTLP